MKNTVLNKLTGNKIDKRRNYILCLDVETAGSIGKPLVYDIGFVVTDSKGNIYEKFSYVISEIFDNSELMTSAYYANKLPLYYSDLEEGKIEKVPFLAMRKQLLECMEIYNIQTISAYNLNFDMRALRTTTEHLYGRGKKFLTQNQKNINLLCLWSFACEVLYSRPSFINFIDKNGLFTEKGNPLTNAQVGYQYLTGKMDFVEEHRGIQDVEIECQIMAKCFAQHKKHKSGILGSPWQIVSKYNKERKNG